MSLNSIIRQGGTVLAITCLLLFILLVTQLANSHYYCSAAYNSDCAPFATSEDTGCTSPGLFQWRSQQDSEIVTLLCPWQSTHAVKVFIMIAISFTVSAFCLYRSLQHMYSKIAVFSIVLILMSLLLLTSGIFDGLELAQNSDEPQTITQFELEVSSKFRFYFNVTLQIICATLMILSCIRMNTSKVHLTDTSPLLEKREAVDDFYDEYD